MTKPDSILSAQEFVNTLVLNPTNRTWSMQRQKPLTLISSKKEDIIKALEARDQAVRNAALEET